MKRHIPSSDIRCDNESLKAEGIVDPESSYHGPSPSDERGEARQYSLSDVACNSDALNVDHNIIGVTPRHPGLGPNDARVATRKPLVDDMELDNSSSDNDSHIGSCTKHLKVNDLGDGKVPDVGSDISSPIERLQVNDLGSSVG